MTSATAPLFRMAGNAPAASVRRGVCPSLAKPMQTGDGLLVRLRPVSGGLSPRELILICQAAGRFGNGILEVTARGNLQIRGVKPQTVEPLTEAVLATGIEFATGLAVETPPLSGLDPSETADPRPLANRIRQALAAREPALVLAAKLSVIVDGGGIFSLDAIVADIRLKAVATGADVLWALSLGGDAGTARPVALLEEEDAFTAVIAVLERLHELGPRARARDLGPDDPCLPVPAGPQAPEWADKRALLRPSGLHDLADGSVMAGIGLAFAQAKAADLEALCAKAAQAGVGSIRLAPGHGLLMPGLGHDDAAGVLAFAASLGFRVTPDDPANAIAVCAGTAGCASAYFDTHALARLFIARAPELLDGSFSLHLSACTKGCAHPPETSLALAGAPLGYGLVVNGSASASPRAYIAANDVASAVDRLATLLRTEKQAGESARSCLTRLGADRIAAALQQDE